MTQLYFIQMTTLVYFMTLLTENSMKCVTGNKCNKLSLNASKTNLMLMGTTYKIRNKQNVKAISLDGCKLMHVS